MTYEDFFSAATGFPPYRWQVRVAREGLPEILPVPTGLGKTEGVSLAWAWRLAAGRDEPRHLVYCLPMRALVRQTFERLDRYFKTLASKQRVEVAVYQLMGGTIEDEWARWPDKPWVLVGTQDQLLSRALNRGYAMSRFEWPVHFGLLNQDCRWIIDEVQLMGPGLWTTAQLDWMRQKRFASIAPCRTTWMSATLGTGFLATTDRKRDQMDAVTPFDPKLDADNNADLRRRLDAIRTIGWFQSTKTGAPLHERLAGAVADQHVDGTLSLIVCNTVEMARDIFEALPDSRPKVLLTSRFRRRDRDAYERQLLEFEERRQAEEKKRDASGNSPDRGKPIPDDPGLICVSTQVVEAGVNVSAHQLWSELAPWPSVIQRLGRLNRDGRDQDAKAWFWETPRRSPRRKEERIGPYEAEDLARSKKLIAAVAPLSKEKPFAQAVSDISVSEEYDREVEEALRPKLEPLPRALDVHGLFSTERDVHGGFTDVSAFVRGADPEADLIVFWRQWENGETGASPPAGDDLDGPPLDMQNEGCPVPFYRLRDTLKNRKARGWVWNDENDAWDRVAPDDLRPGMVVMLHRAVGGYDARLGWTGAAGHILSEVPAPGRGRTLRDDSRAEIGRWVSVPVHLEDARKEATAICDALKLQEPFRLAVIEGAARHDWGKVHPQWQEALPAADGLDGGPWAKCPHVVAVDVEPMSVGLSALKALVSTLRPQSQALTPQPRRRGRKEMVRLRWAVGQRLSSQELAQLRSVPGVYWAGDASFRPKMRHEAASALAMWYHYLSGNASYPALAVYLVAAHHGKVRTALRTLNDGGDDVFGVPRDSDALQVCGTAWPLDFSIAKDGADGEWADGQFILRSHGWTGLVADLLGPWRADDVSDVGVVPMNEPRKLGPFVLAYLEALVRVADWRASEHPSQGVSPAEVRCE